MPTLTISTTYADDAGLTEAQLDAIKTSLETFVNTTKLDGDNIQDGSVNTGQIATVAVTTAKIADGAATADAIQSDSLFDANRAVGTNHIMDEAVTTAKIADGAVTYDKITPVTFARALMDSSFTVAAGVGLQDVAALDTEITVTGSRPVLVGLVPYTATASTASVAAMIVKQSEIFIYRDATVIASVVSNASTRQINLPGIITIDTPSAGTYTYTAKVQRNDAAGSITLARVQLFAMEL